MTHLDIWVCQGRLCTANGADEVAAEARAEAQGACRLLRGGCYGHCELGPNVVVRAHEHRVPDADDDRLSLTEEPNETVYSGVTPAGVALIIAAHREGRIVRELTRDARLGALPPTSAVAAKIRALRARRRGGPA